MSQAKVDRYKESKLNRQSELKKKKFRRNLERCAVALVCLGLVGWLGYSVYIQRVGVTRSVTEINVDAITDYRTALNETEASAATVE